MLRDDVRVVVVLVLLVAAVVEVRSRYPVEAANRNKLHSVVCLLAAAAAMVHLQTLLVVMWANLVVLLLSLLFPGHDVHVGASSSQLYPLRNDPVLAISLPSVLPIPQSYPSVLVAVLADQIAVLEQADHIAVHSPMLPQTGLELVVDKGFRLASNSLARGQSVAGSPTEPGEGRQ